MKFIIICLLLIFISCYGQGLKEKELICGNKSVSIKLPEILKTQEHSFEEGKTTLLTTKDSVLIEFYCGGNYLPHISNKKRYKLLSKKNSYSLGVDLKTGLYWRKDGKLIYSNCKEKDTALYNQIFNDKKSNTAR